MSRDLSAEMWSEIWSWLPRHQQIEIPRVCRQWREWHRGEVGVMARSRICVDAPTRALQRAIFTRWWRCLERPDANWVEVLDLTRTVDQVTVQRIASRAPRLRVLHLGEWTCDNSYVLAPTLQELSCGAFCRTHPLSIRRLSAELLVTRDLARLTPSLQELTLNSQFWCHPDGCHERQCHRDWPFQHPERITWPPTLTALTDRGCLLPCCYESCPPVQYLSAMMMAVPVPETLQYLSLTLLPDPALWPQHIRRLHLATPDPVTFEPWRLRVNEFLTDCSLVPSDLQERWSRDQKHWQATCGTIEAMENWQSRGHDW